jgi:hypothetical protein
LRVAYPIGIEPFVENIKRGEKPARGDGDIPIPRVVEFHIVERFLDRAGEVAGVSVAPLKIALEPSPRFKNQIVPKRHQYNRGNDRDQRWIAAVPDGYERRKTGKHRNWLRISHKRRRRCGLLRQADTGCHNANHRYETTPQQSHSPFLDIMS